MAPLRGRHLFWESRVLGHEHFPSDVIIGSAAGWLVGHYVYGEALN